MNAIDIVKSVISDLFDVPVSELRDNTVLNSILEIGTECSRDLEYLGLVIMLELEGMTIPDGSKDDFAKKTIVELANFIRPL